MANRLKALSAHDERLKSVVEMLESAEAQAGEAVRELRNYASRVELDPQALRDTEARIEALHAAARKHRVRPEALHELLMNLEKRLGELELAVNPEALQREVNAARKHFESAAKKLSAKRRSAAENHALVVHHAVSQYLKVAVLAVVGFARHAKTSWSRGLPNRGTRRAAAACPDRGV